MKPPIVQLLQKLPHFMEPEGSSPCSQEPSTGPYPEPFLSSPYYPFLFSIFYLLFGLWGYWHCGHSWPIVPASGDSEDVCGEADGM
jgi:hypothetical protein